MKRIGNPVPSFTNVTKPEKSKGKQAIALYAATRQKLMEWQQTQIIGLMARDGKNLWSYPDWCLSLSRRNGKGEILAARELWGILAAGEKILHTAHRTSTSHDAYERLYRLLIRGGFEERQRKKGKGLPGTFYASKQYGLETIIIYGGGEIHFRTRTDTGGLGEGFDVLVVDEAQEYTSKQQSALTYTVSAAKNPQTILVGTPPTATSKGDVFPRFRRKIMEGKSDLVGWTEWSIEKLTEDIEDVELWYRLNPSLGLILSERNIRRELTTGVVDFNVQRLGLWLSYKQDSAISPKEWEDVRVEDVPELEPKRFWGIKFGIDGTNVALSVASKTTDGRVYVEHIECEPVRDGTDWLIEFLKNPKTAKVAVDGASGQQIMVDAMKEAKIAKKPVLPTVKEIIAANAMFETGLQGNLAHVEQAKVTRIVTNCEKRAIGSNGGFGYRSQVEDADVAIMDSMILAYWLAMTTKTAAPQKINY